MAIQSRVLTTTAANIFASTTTTGDVVSVMYFCNRTASPTTFDLYVVPAGSTANVNNLSYSHTYRDPYTTPSDGDKYLKYPQFGVLS